MIRRPFPIVHQRRSRGGRSLACLAAISAVALGSALTQDAPIPATTEPAPASVEPDLPSANLPAPDLTVPPAQSIPSALPSEQLRVVRSINIKPVKGSIVDPNRVLANMSLKVGSAYTPDKSDADIKNLQAAGFIANIIAEPVGTDGLNLVVLAEARTPVGSIEFSGNSALSAKDLKEETELREGSVISDQKLIEAQRKLNEYYQKKGFPDVRITYREEKDPGTQFTRLIFSIDEGTRMVLNKVRFDGNSVYSEKDLRKLVEVGARESAWKVWDWTRRVSNEQLDKDRDAVEAKYRNSGFMKAKVTGIDRIPVGDKVDIVFHISEGQKYDVTSTGIEGMKKFPKEELLPSLQVAPGEAFSAADVKADMKLIHDYYGARGYADVQVNPRIAEVGGQQVGITYMVTEGEISYINKINIDGNAKTKDEVIRRELAVLPGEEFSTTKIDVSRRRLEQLGYFEQQGGVEFFPADSERPNYKDLNITVRERSTGSVNFGAGFSSIDKLVGFVDVSQSNFDIKNWPSFTGAGQKFRLGIKYGTKRRDAVVEWIEPWFMDQRLALGTELYYRDSSYQSDRYDDQRIGSSISLTKPLGEHDRLRFEYRLQQVKIHNVEKLDVPQVDGKDDPDFFDPIAAEEGTYLDSSVGAIYTHDTRDNILGVTRSGHKITAEGYVSGLGGDVETYSFGLEGAQYFSLPFDFVFKLQGNFEVVDNWGGDRVPIFQRKFLGGANNLRGYDYREAGPKDPVDGEPLGGKTAAYATAELNFPIMNRVRGVVFMDVGQVSEDYFDVGSDWDADVGIGLHLFLLPQGPLRLEFAVPLRTDEFNDSNGKFNFNIGYQF